MYDDVGLYVLGCRVDILGTPYVRRTKGIYILCQSLEPVKLKVCQSVASLGRCVRRTNKTEGVSVEQLCFWLAYQAGLVAV